MKDNYFLQRLREFNNSVDLTKGKAPPPQVVEQEFLEVIDDKYPIREGDDMDMENSISLKRLIKLGTRRKSGTDFQEREEGEDDQKSSARFLTDPRAIESEHQKLLRQRSYLQSDAEKTSLGRMTSNEKDQNS